MQNLGSIGGLGTANTIAVDFFAGGTLNNSGSISSYLFGLSSSGATATIINTGMIHPTGTAGEGLSVDGGVRLTNMTGGIILAQYVGVFSTDFASGAATIVNAGTIGVQGPKSLAKGVALAGNSQDFVSNQGSGRIYGPTVGLRFGSGGTLVNQGTIQARGLVNSGTGVQIGARSSITNCLLAGRSPDQPPVCR